MGVIKGHWKKLQTFDCYYFVFIWTFQALYNDLNLRKRATSHVFNMLVPMQHGYGPSKLYVMLAIKICCQVNAPAYLHSPCHPDPPPPVSWLVIQLPPEPAKEDDTILCSLDGWAWGGGDPTNTWEEEKVLWPAWFGRQRWAGPRKGVGTNCHSKHFKIRDADGAGEKRRQKKR